MECSEGIFKWARDHNCKFGVEKFQLLDILKKTIPHALNPRKHIPLPRRTLTLNNVRIPSKEIAKFLGVIVDNKMNWKGQSTTALMKGQDWIIQFSRIAQASCGVTARYVRQLYLSIAIPQILYAADIFLTPQKKTNQKPKNRKLNQAFVNKLTTIQQKAAIMITGAMRTTATDILDVMANLLPIHLLIDKHRQQAALRMATLPPTHYTNQSKMPHND
jgi:hypothetical protein